MHVPVRISSRGITVEASHSIREAKQLSFDTAVRDYQQVKIFIGTRLKEKLVGLLKTHDLSPALLHALEA